MSLYDIYPEMIADKDISVTDIKESDNNTSSFKLCKVILLMLTCAGVYCVLKYNESKKRSKLKDKIKREINRTK